MDTLVSFVVVKAQQFALLGNNSIITNKSGVVCVPSLLCLVSVDENTTSLVGGGIVSVITLVYPVLKCLSNF